MHKKQIQKVAPFTILRNVKISCRRWQTSREISGVYLWPRYWNQNSSHGGCEMWTLESNEAKVLEYLQFYRLLGNGGTRILRNRQRRSLTTKQRLRGRNKVWEGEAGEHNKSGRNEWKRATSVRAGLISRWGSSETVKGGRRGIMGRSDRLWNERRTGWKGEWKLVVDC